MEQSILPISELQSHFSNYFSMNENKYIILDRDGVINYDSPSYIKKAHDWKPIPKSLEALGLLFVKTSTKL